jgi:hypothetical protein
MQRGRYLQLVVMTGTLALSGWLSRPASADLTAVDVGGPGVAGSTSAPTANGVIIQKGSGADIWGTNDQFQYAYQKVTGDGSIEAELLSQSSTPNGTGGIPCCVKSGVMIRTSANDDAANINLAQNSEFNRGVLWEYRPRDGESSTGGGTLYAPRVFPITLRLERRGDYIYGWTSIDGRKTYQRAGYPITLDPPNADLLFGLSTTAHMDGSVATSVFDNVKVGTDLLPDPVNVQASARDKSAVVTWDSPGGTGVTFNVYAHVAPPVNNGAPAPPTAGPPGATDYYWVKVNDSPVTGNSYVIDGLTNGTIYDVAVSAVVNGAERSPQTPEAGADGVGLVGPVVPEPAAKIAGIDNWSVYNIGTRDPGLASVDASGVITMQAGGNDAWNNADGISYLAVPITGDFTAITRIVSGPTAGAGTDGWTNGGLMARDTLAPSSRFANAQIAEGSASNPLQFKKRLVAGRTPENVDNPLADDTARPVWFRLTRRGLKFTAEYSQDKGTDATKVAWKPMDGGNGDGSQTATFAGFANNAWIGIYLTGRGEGSGLYSKMVADNVSISQP